MLFVVLPLVLAIISMFVIKDLIPYLRYIKYYKRQGIKYWYIPILGSIGLLSPGADDSIEKLKKDVNEKYEEDDIIALNTVDSTSLIFLIKSPAALKEYLIKEVECTQRTDIIEGPLDLGFFLQTGKEALRVRAIFNDFFEPRNISRLAPHVQELVLRHIKALKEEIKKLQKNENDFVEKDLKTFFPDLFSDMVDNILFGKDNCPLIEGKKFSHKTEEVARMSMGILQNPINALSFGFAHSLRLLKVSRRMFSLGKKINDSVLGFIEKRQKKLDGELGLNLVDLMIRHNRSLEDQSKKLTIKEMVNNILLFQVAGQDTTKNTLESFFKVISQKQEILKKIVEEEIPSIVSSQEDLRCMETYERSSYLNNVWDEMMRYLGSANFTFARKIIKDMKIGKYTLKRGDRAFVCMVSQNYNKNNFENPYEFNPSRFNAENRKRIKRNTYMPFYEGRRGCAGKYFAQLLQKIISVNFLREFELRDTGKKYKTGQTFGFGVLVSDVLLRPIN